MTGKSERMNGIDQLLEAAKRIEQMDMKKYCRHKKLIVRVHGKLFELCILERKEKETTCGKNSVTFGRVYHKASDQKTMRQNNGKHAIKK